jgi:hypothetical protein
MRIHTDLWMPSLLYVGLLVAPHKSKIHGKYPPKLNLFDYFIALCSGGLVLVNLWGWGTLIFYAQALNIFRRYSYNNPFK